MKAITATSMLVCLIIAGCSSSSGSTLSPDELELARAAFAIAQAQNDQVDDDTVTPDVPDNDATTCTCGGTGKTGDGLGPCPCIANGGTCSCVSTTVPEEVDDPHVSISELIALYLSHKAAIDEQWLSMDDSATLRDATLAWIDTQQIDPDSTDRPEPPQESEIDVPDVPDSPEINAAPEIPSPPPEAEHEQTSAAFSIDSWISALDAPCVLYFWSPSCVYCPAAKQHVVTWLRNANWNVVEVNVDTEQQISDALGVFEVPSFIGVNTSGLVSDRAGRPRIVTTSSDGWAVTALFGKTQPAKTNVSGRSGNYYYQTELLPKGSYCEVCGKHCSNPMRRVRTWQSF